MSDGPVLRSAVLRWDGATPVSREFGDRYFSAGEGPAESTHVFINGNRLQERFQHHGADDPFRILETGFGTGLNFLLTAELWRRSDNPAWLDYYSIEGMPLSAADLHKAVRFLLPDSRLAGRLINKYPPAVQGFYRVEFPGHRVRLQLCWFEIGTALDQLGDAEGKFDAIFLDGFSPALNPAMWTADVLGPIARMCRFGGTFSTFTSAGQVRRILQSTGFTVRRADGFGRKRQHLCGEMSISSGAGRQRRITRVAVVGAGLAGCATARSMAARSVQTIIFETSGEFASTGNALPAAVYGPQLSADFNLTSQIYWHGLARIDDYLTNNPDIGARRHGICFFAGHKEDRIRYQKLFRLLEKSGCGVEWLSPEQASGRFNVASAVPALYMPRGGAVSTAGLRERWLDEGKECIRLIRSRVDSVEPNENAWRINHTQGIDEFDAVVLCTGARLRLVEGFGIDAIRLNHGRAKLVQRDDLPASGTVLSFRGYLTPEISSVQGRIFGASYERRVPDHEIGRRMLDQKIHRLYQCTGVRLEQLAPDTDAELTGWRAESLDRLPLVGPRGAQTPGLFLNLAHASRGVTSSLVCAETVAAQILDDLPPLPRRLTKMISPARFDQ